MSFLLYKELSFLYKMTSPYLYPLLQCVDELLITITVNNYSTFDEKQENNQSIYTIHYKSDANTVTQTKNGDVTGESLVKQLRELAAEIDKIIEHIYTGSFGRKIKIWVKHGPCTADVEDEDYTPDPDSYGNTPILAKSLFETIREKYAQHTKTVKIEREMLRQAVFRSYETLGRTIFMIADYGEELNDKSGESFGLRHLRRDVIFAHLSSYKKDADFIQENFLRLYPYSKLPFSKKANAYIEVAAGSLQTMMAIHNLCQLQMMNRETKFEMTKDFFYRTSDLVVVRDLGSIVKFDFDRFYQENVEYRI